MERGTFENYLKLLSQYLEHESEKSLYKGHQFSRYMLEQNVSPEEAINLHMDVLTKLIPHIDPKVKASFDFLLEVMIGYGFAYREHQSLRSKQQQLESEIDIAADVQNSLLLSEIPEVDFFDIGLVSKPAKKMSGDYYHFVRDKHNRLSVAIADVIGKGIPAAMCMSMIKYSMDSLPLQHFQPSLMLESLNRVVEQNVDPSMFITMFYGQFDPVTRRFSFSSAGHEPGFYYNAKEKRFEEIAAKGRVLGLSSDTTYQEYERYVEPGDVIVLLSDGVTECRTKNGFIERAEIAHLIECHIEQPAQEIANQVYKELERLQDFQLRDDFTLIILKHEV
jgi:phosphoserine phosphatase RsbU/P